MRYQKEKKKRTNDVELCEWISSYYMFFCNLFVRSIMEIIVSSLKKHKEIFKCFFNVRIVGANMLIIHMFIMFLFIHIIICIDCVTKLTRNRISRKLFQKKVNGLISQK